MRKVHRFKWRSSRRRPCRIYLFSRDEVAPAALAPKNRGPCSLAPLPMLRAKDRHKFTSHRLIVSCVIRGVFPLLLQQQQQTSIHHEAIRSSSATSHLGSIDRCRPKIAVCECGSNKGWRLGPVLNSISHTVALFRFSSYCCIYPLLSFLHWF